VSGEELRAEHISRINRVMDHIEAHLDEQLSLDELAKVACYSPHHFHKIFHAAVGETLHQFVGRLRIERAARRLAFEPDVSITTIAMHAGFATPSTFARAFKAHFGESASSWRRARRSAPTRRAGPRLDLSKLSCVSPARWELSGRHGDVASIELREIAPMEVAYVRHQGAYFGDGALFTELFTKLCDWARPLGLLEQPEAMCFTVIHDDAAWVDEQRLRVDACLRVPPQTRATGEIGRASVAGGLYAVGRFELTEVDYTWAWTQLLEAWLPVSDYQLDERLCYEAYPPGELTGEHPGASVVELRVPVLRRSAGVHEL